MRAAAAVGADFAGVDILHGADGPTVLEVNSMPAWSGLQKVTPFSIAAILAGDLLAAAECQDAAGSRDVTAVADTVDKIAAAFQAACRDELDAPKPGNVHVFADGHRMTADQFVRSAAAAAGPLTRARRARRSAHPRRRGGHRRRRSAPTPISASSCCAPRSRRPPSRQPSDLRGEVARVLDDLDVEDARLAFRAIATAQPGGIGPGRAARRP